MRCSVSDMARKDSPPLSTVALFCGGLRFGAGLEERGRGMCRASGGGGDCRSGPARGWMLEPVTRLESSCLCLLWFVTTKGVTSLVLDPVPPRATARASLAAAIDGLWIRIQAGMSIVWSASELVLHLSDMLYDV
jgi:hypothetical protein